MLVALGVIWGMPYLFIKIAVDGGVAPPLVVLARTALGALLLAPFAVRGLGALRGRWVPVIAFAVLEVVGPWLMLSRAEVTLSSSTVGLLVATVPILAVVVGRVAGDRQRVAAHRSLGLAVAFGGVLVLTGPGLRAGHGLAVAEVMVAVVGYAVAPVIAERALQGLPGTVLTFATLLIATVVYAPVVALTGPHPMPGRAEIGALVVLGVVCTAAAFLVFFRLISEVGGPRATLVAYLNPIVAVLLGAAVLSEPLTGAVALAAGLILGGSALAAARRAPWRPRTTAPVPDATPIP
jgi:drug/metabolite transporter (DMT)-like permease